MNRKNPRAPSTKPARAAGRPPRAAAARNGAIAKKSATAPAAEPPAARKRGRPKGSHNEPPPPPGSGRLIRRYGNRRLYDAQLSRCVTMEEIAGFVRAGEELRVVDADSGADITKRILVQIILEEQNREQLELLPVALLRSMLSLKSESLSGWLEQYLAAGADWMERATRQMTAVAAPAAPAAGWQWPFGGAGNMAGMGAPGGVPGFGGMGVPGFPGFGGSGGMTQPQQENPAPAQAPSATAAGATSRDADAELRRRLEELERNLSDLRHKRRA